MIRRIDKNIIQVECQNTRGFGMQAESVMERQKVELLDAEEFDRVLARNKPSGHHKNGFNRGAPINGLCEWTSTASGIRYLVDLTGAGMRRKYAERKSVEGHFSRAIK